MCARVCATKRKHHSAHTLTHSLSHSRVIAHMRGASRLKQQHSLTHSTSVCVAHMHELPQTNFNTRRVHIKTHNRRHTSAPPACTSCPAISDNPPIASLLISSSSVVVDNNWFVYQQSECFYRLRLDVERGTHTDTNTKRVNTKQKHKRTLTRDYIIVPSCHIFAYLSAVCAGAQPDIWAPVKVNNDCRHIQ